MWRAVSVQKPPLKAKLAKAALAFDGAAFNAVDVNHTSPSDHKASVLAIIVARCGGDARVCQARREFAGQCGFQFRQVMCIGIPLTLDRAR